MRLFIFMQTAYHHVPDTFDWRDIKEEWRSQKHLCLCQNISSDQFNGRRDLICCVLNTDHRGTARSRMGAPSEESSAMWVPFQSERILWRQTSCTL
ncbi:hypothetical protein TNCV_2198061 [Trichonephila clavipes]|nr:hypothetical protein TNCV_2198061 [Trichonephila clavipes]